MIPTRLSKISRRPASMSPFRPGFVVKRDRLNPSRSFALAVKNKGVCSNERSPFVFHWTKNLIFAYSSGKFYYWSTRFSKSFLYPPLVRKTGSSSPLWQRGGRGDFINHNCFHICSKTASRLFNTSMSENRRTAIPALAI